MAYLRRAVTSRDCAPTEVLTTMTAPSPSVISPRMIPTKPSVETVAVGVCTTLSFGLLRPARRAARLDPVEALRAE